MLYCAVAAYGVRTSCRPLGRGEASAVQAGLQLINELVASRRRLHVAVNFN